MTAKTDNPLEEALHWSFLFHEAIAATEICDAKDCFIRFIRSYSVYFEKTENLEVLESNANATEETIEIGFEFICKNGFGREFATIWQSLQGIHFYSEDFYEQLARYEGGDFAAESARQLPDIEFRCDSLLAISRLCKNMQLEF